MTHSFQPAILQTGLSEADLRLLCSFDHHQAFVERGKEICSSSTKLHFIMDGWAYKYRISRRGSRQLTGVYFSDEICDLDKLFFPGLGFGVQAASDCRVAEIPVESLKAAAADDPAVRDLLWSLIVLENVAVTELATSFGSRTARERLAWFFCDLEDRLKACGRNTEDTFRLELTQGDIADCLGFSVVHTNRILQGLDRGTDQQQRFKVQNIGFCPSPVRGGL